MKEVLLKKTYDFVKQHHAADNSGHDFFHIKRVYENACLLAENAPFVDDFIVKMSALLHDVDDYKLKTDGKSTFNFLQSLKLEDKIIDKILTTINAISFSKSGAKPDFETIEMKILSDADKLDAIGAIGICRTIMFGAQNHRPLFDENIFPQNNLSKEQYKDLNREENNSINHFFDKLLKLKEAMQTEVGKKEAQKRHNFMVKFLKQFFEEQNLPRWQSYLEDYLALKVY